MSLRDRLSISLKEAMRAKDATRLMTLRLINAAIKDRDIDARSIGNETGVSDADLLAILSKINSYSIANLTTTLETSGGIQLLKFFKIGLRKVAVILGRSKNNTVLQSDDI